MRKPPQAEADKMAWEEVNNIINASFSSYENCCFKGFEGWPDGMLGDKLRMWIIYRKTFFSISSSIECQFE